MLELKRENPQLWDKWNQLFTEMKGDFRAGKKK